MNKVSPSTILELESEPAGKLVVHGPNCRIRVGRKVQLNADIIIHPDVSNAVIDIADGCILNGLIWLIRGDGPVVRIGERTTFNHVGVSMHEAATVTFGADCMLSTDVQMDTSDMHPIYDRATGVRLNPPQNITIGDHVWLGTRVLVMKGATIGSGSVIGAGSIVAGTIPEHVLAVGAPAKVVRHNVVWTRDMDEKPRLDPDSAPPPAPEQPAPAAPKRRWFG